MGGSGNKEEFRRGPCSRGVHSPDFGDGGAFPGGGLVQDVSLEVNHHGRLEGKSTGAKQTSDWQASVFDVSHRVLISPREKIRVSLCSHFSGALCILWLVCHVGAVFALKLFAIRLCVIAFYSALDVSHRCRVEVRGPQRPASALWYIGL